MRVGLNMNLDDALESFAKDGRSLRHSCESVEGSVRITLRKAGTTLSGQVVNLSAGGVGGS